MSSSASRGGGGGGGGERMIHQDFIARIRFSNALPPPPNPPKLLDIPNTGLASGQYTAPGFASRLAREQPLNIEADAELGMPLDLVGMPGIFDGDESSIQAPAQKPQVHPHDQPLLKPLSALGKPKVSDAAVSFLRRTEYISSVASKHRAESSALRPNSGNTAKRPDKRKSPEPDAGTPAYVKRKIERSFDVALANARDPSRVKHPTRKNARLVEAYPMLPDLDAFPDSGAYVTVKFASNPVGTSDSYDSRLLSGVFMPVQRSAAEEAEFEAAMEAHELDPQNNPRPSTGMNYDFFLPDTTAASDGFRRKFDLDNPDRDDDALYTARGDDQAGVFHFNRVRAYETAEEKELGHDTKYTEEIIISIAETADGNPAAMYYPVMQRTTLRSQRRKNIARTAGLAGPEDEEETIDRLDVTVADPTEDMLEHIQKIKRNPLHFHEEGDDDGAPDSQTQLQQEHHGAEEEEDEEHDDAAELDAQLNGGASDGDSPVANGHGGHEVESDEDAEGDEE